MIRIRKVWPDRNKQLQAWRRLRQINYSCCIIGNYDVTKLPEFLAPYVHTHTPFTVYTNRHY